MTIREPASTVPPMPSRMGCSMKTGDESPATHRHRRPVCNAGRQLHTGCDSRKRISKPNKKPRPLERPGLIS
jgi:hypothetical protein